MSSNKMTRSDFEELVRLLKISDARIRDLKVSQLQGRLVMEGKLER